MKEKQVSSLLGNFTGRIGDFIVYMHRQQRCIRRVPEHMPPPSSPGQLAQQERIASVAIFYRVIKGTGLYNHWRKAAKGLVQNGYNLFVRENLKAFKGDGRICDFSKLRLTKGEVALPDGLGLRRGGDGEWVLEWENTPRQANARGEDEVRIYAMKDAETFDVKLLDAGLHCREEGRAVFRMEGECKDFFHLYVIFCCTANGSCSDSRYFSLT